MRLMSIIGEIMLKIAQCGFSSHIVRENRQPPAMTAVANSTIVAFAKLFENYSIWLKNVIKIEIITKWLQYNYSFVIIVDFLKKCDRIIYRDSN